MNGRSLLAVDVPPERAANEPPITPAEPVCRWSDDLSDEATCTAPVYVYIWKKPYCSFHGSIIYRCHVELYPNEDIDIRMRRFDGDDPTNPKGRRT